jgi:sugar-specific transcriptional regulator TrmB
MSIQKEVKQNIYTSLKELGLTDNEIALYTLSLSLGPTTISKLAEHLAISRPNIYKIIEGLERHELAKFSERKRFRRTFMVESPTVVLDLLRQKKKALSRLDENITQVMPQLLAFYHQGELPTSIKIIKGKQDFVDIYRKIIDEAKDVSEFFGSVKDFIGFISWSEERRFIKDRVKKGINMKALLLPSQEAEELKATDKKELRETRILNVKLPFATSFQLFANKVIIWQPKAKLAVLIEDEYIVEMLRSIFYTLWDISN